MWDPLIPADLVIPRTGLWLLAFSISRDTAAAALSFRPRITRNGAAFLPAASPATTSVLREYAAAAEELDQGDVLQLVLNRNPNTAGAVNIPAANTYLSAVRIGPERWT